MKDIAPSSRKANSRKLGPKSKKKKKEKKKKKKVEKCTTKETNKWKNGKHKGNHKKKCTTKKKKGSKGMYKIKYYELSYDYKTYLIIILYYISWFRWLLPKRKPCNFRGWITEDSKRSKNWKQDIDVAEWTSHYHRGTWFFGKEHFLYWHVL